LAQGQPRLWSRRLRTRQRYKLDKSFVAETERQYQQLPEESGANRV
jgi:hypothetical protein